MKTVIRGVDDIVYRFQIERQDGTEFLLSDFDDFEISVFTSDIATCYNVESEYIDTDENLVKIPAEKIASAGLAFDDKFPDGEYNQTNTVDTCYFLKTISD